MMTAKLHQRISRLLQRTIANFCRERVSYDRKLRVVGLVALNIDDDDVDVLVKMDETFMKENEVCDEDDDEEDVEAMDYDTERRRSQSPVVLVDSSTSAPGTAPSAAATLAEEQEFEEGEDALSSPLPDALSPQSRRVGSPIETREEADTNFCLLEDEEEVVPLPPPLSSVIDRLHDDVDGCVTDDLAVTCNDRIQICTSTSIVTPLFHHKQKRKRFRPMRLYQPDNGYILSVTGGSHSSEDPPSPSPYLPTGSDFTMLPDLVDASPGGSLGDPKTTVDLPLPPLPSSDTGSGEDAMDLSEEPTDEDPDTRAIVLNGIDSSPGTVDDGVADSGDVIPMSPVPGDVVEEVEVTSANGPVSDISSAMPLDDEDLQITGEYCRLPTLPLLPTLPPPPLPPRPPPSVPHASSLTAVTLPLLSLPITGPTGAINSIPLIPLRQVTNTGAHSLVSSTAGGLTQPAAPRQFALIAPGTGILLPSNLPTGQQQQHQQQQPPQHHTPTAATILATATKSLTVTAALPVSNSVNSSSSANSIISSLSTSTSSSCSPTTTTSTTSRSTMLSSSTISKSKTLSILSSTGGGPRSRRSALKFHHSPITIPAAAAALRPLPTMTSSGSSVASSLMRHYNCRYCGKMFNRKFCLERHERLHTGVKPYACTCCGERFIRLEDKKRHVRTVHEPSPPGGAGGGGLVDEKSSNGLDSTPGSTAAATTAATSTMTSSGSSSASTSAHMLSIISAVAAAAAAASSSTSSTAAAERKTAAASKR